MVVIPSRAALTRVSSVTAYVVENLSSLTTVISVLLIAVTSPRWTTIVRKPPLPSGTTNSPWRARRPPSLPSSWGPPGRRRLGRSGRAPSPLASGLGDADGAGDTVAVGVLSARATPVAPAARPATTAAAATMRVRTGVMTGPPSVWAGRGVRGPFTDGDIRRRA